ncbi:MAG: hypothetical protein PHP59_06490, partial [Methanofollis sp.]|uniref:hypothetical protein n=1 Tax=Methanofollis sp. TaxID=2052835 RepID=UPI0026338821
MTARRLFVVAAIAGLLLYLAGGIGVASAFFSDGEATGNIFSAWIPACWETTTQEDFESGILYHVSVLPNGAVTIAAGGSGDDADMMLFWASVDPPDGWECISDEEGDLFYERFPRGANLYLPWVPWLDTVWKTGGTPTHTHEPALESLNSSGPSAWETLRYKPGGKWLSLRGRGHTHLTLGSETTVSEASHLPPYQDLQIIRCLEGTPLAVPAGAIAPFISDIPEGWMPAYNDNRYLRGGSGTGTGGAPTHTHTVQVTTGFPLAGWETILYDDSGNETVVTKWEHTHTATGETAPGDNEPPFITVQLGQATGDSTVPTGMTAMFNALPGDGWKVQDIFEERFLVANSTPGVTGGSDGTHSHPDLMIPTGEPDPTATDPIKSGDSGTEVARPGHTHNVTIGFWRMLFEDPRIENPHLPP